MQPMDDPHGNARHTILDQLMQDPEISRPAELAATLTELLAEGGHLATPVATEIAAAEPGPAQSNDPRYMPLIHTTRLFLYRGARSHVDGSVGEVDAVLMVVDVSLDGLVSLLVYNVDGTKRMVDDPRAVPGSTQMHLSIDVPIDRIKTLTEDGSWDLDWEGRYRITADNGELELVRAA